MWCFVQVGEYQGAYKVPSTYLLVHFESASFNYESL
jgi:hypothetical protein